jgi:Uri superfamily endonuclease
MRLAEHPHWHIDYLHLHTTLEEIWFCHDQKSREHDWARCFAGMRGASMPMAGFGASDSGCETHLSFLKKRPLPLTGFWPSDCDCESHRFFFRERPARKIFNRCLEGRVRR